MHHIHLINGLFLLFVAVDVVVVDVVVDAVVVLFFTLFGWVFVGVGSTNIPSFSLIGTSCGAGSAFDNKEFAFIGTHLFF